MDDCGDCQSGYCYDYVTHQVSFGACDGPTQMYVDPNSDSNPYWNQSCTDCAGTVNGDAMMDDCGVCAGDNSTCTDCSGVVNGDAMMDDCGDCQSGYCYDYVTHQVSFGACDGPTQMYVDPNSDSNPYWNQSCTDCAGTVNGDAMMDDCGVCAGDNSTCTDCNGIVNGLSLIHI